MMNVAVLILMSLAAQSPRVIDAPPETLRNRCSYNDDVGHYKCVGRSARVTIEEKTSSHSRINAQVNAAIMWNNSRGYPMREGPRIAPGLALVLGSDQGPIDILWDSVTLTVNGEAKRAAPFFAIRDKIKSPKPQRVAKGAVFKAKMLDTNAAASPWLAKQDNEVSLTIELQDGKSRREVRYEAKIRFDFIEGNALLPYSKRPEVSQGLDKPLEPQAVQAPEARNEGMGWIVGASAGMLVGGAAGAGGAFLMGEPDSALGFAMIAALIGGLGGGATGFYLASSPSEGDRDYARYRQALKQYRKDQANYEKDQKQKRAYEAWTRQMPKSDELKLIR